jgi:RNA polymerase sigma-70 factor (ECF subfamily)
MRTTSQAQTFGADPARDLSRRRDEAELVQRCVSGEREAAFALHQQYFPVASAFLRKLGTRSEELEDACQDVFLQFFRYLPSFRGEAQLKTWLYRLCITEARRARQRRRLRGVVAKVLRREHRRDVEPPATSSEASMRQRVERGLDGLPEGHRLVFVLFELEGLPGPQVAEIAGCSMATMWRRLHEVRRSCREMLGLELPCDEDST